jgi:glutamate-ammonia-ligase adenylyltransferase
MRRTAEQLVEALTAYTRDGTVYSVDPRLRPHGREGELVVTPAQLQAYFRDEAHPWEALTYAKLRHVAGDHELGYRTVEVVRSGIADMAARASFAAELRDMRARLERSETVQNLKTGPGGSYDIDYLAGAMQVRHRLWLARNLAARLRLLQSEGLLKEDEFELLSANAHFFRTVEHIVRLVTGRARKWLPVAEHPRRAVQKLLWRMLGADDSFDPEMRLAEAMRQTREIYSRYSGA